MSWLRIESVPAGKYSPEDDVSAFVEKHGAVGRAVLYAYDTADPLNCAYMPDEYLSYAERFIKNLEERKTLEMGVEEIEHIVESTFGEDQLANFVRGGSVEEIASYIKGWMLYEDKKTESQT